MTVPQPVVLNEAELRRLCGVDLDALSVVEDSFRWHAEQRVTMPPIMHIGVPDYGDVDIKAAYVQGLDSLAVKLGSGFFGNPALGLPSSSALVVVMSARTGLCEAVLLDNGYLTNLRTGMAGAVAAKHLAPPEVTSVGVLGAGAQARFQLECLQTVRSFSEVRVWSKSPASAEALASEASAALGVEVIARTDPEEVVRSSQLLITTTPSHEPIVRGEWLSEGMHITAVGSDTPAKQELWPDCFRNAALIACDSISQCTRLGELHHAASGQVLDGSQQVVELGQLILGRIDYRRAPRHLTICDLTGMGVQDTAIAWLAMKRHMEDR